MPVTVELKYEYFQTWPGRIKIGELLLGILAMACCAPAYWSTQHWFLIVTVLAFLGSVFYSAYYLCLDIYLKGVNVNWLQTEVWFTAIFTFLYFTAAVAQLAEFCGFDEPALQYWYDAQVAAGVFALINNALYAIGAYFLYLEWKANPEGATANGPMPPI